MRVCVAGGGISGTLLTWRLAQRPEVERVDLLIGDDGQRDATELSGGVVRAYERHPEGRRLALQSLAELQSSSVLRAWSQYRETGALYLRAGEDALTGELDALEAQLPGSARIATGPELARLGWAGLPAGAVGVLERRAGYISPSRLRRALVADLTTRANVRVLRAAAGAVVCVDGGVRVTMPGPPRGYDVAVLAAGAWTPRVLDASGLPSIGLRTKAIQSTTYAVSGRRPMPFADETTGLYGKPGADGTLLLGIATAQWDVVPGERPPVRALQASAARIARERMPWLKLGRALATASASDCYCEPPVLALHRVAGDEGPIWTFTGGSGGSVKTALAASREAADRLLGSRRLQPSTHGE